MPDKLLLIELHTLKNNLKTLLDNEPWFMYKKGVELKTFIVSDEEMFKSKILITYWT